MIAEPQARKRSAVPRIPRASTDKYSERTAAGSSGQDAKPNRTLVASGKPVRRRKPTFGWHGNYRITIELSLILALLVVIGLVRTPLRMGEAFEVTVAEQEIVQMEEVITTKQEVKPPPPPRPPVPVEVPNDTVLESDIDLNLDATLDFDDPLTDIPPPPPPPVQEAEAVVEEEPSEIFVAVEQMPELIGGMQGLTERIEYPEIARLAGLEGRVIVQFVIDEQGRVSEAIIIRSQGASLDEEALRVVRSAMFEPGRQRGKAVKVRMSIPITFRLRDVKK